MIDLSLSHIGKANPRFYLCLVSLQLGLRQVQARLQIFPFILIVQILRRGPLISKLRRSVCDLCLPVGKLFFGIRQSAPVFLDLLPGIRKL